LTDRLKNCAKVLKKFEINGIFALKNKYMPSIFQTILIIVLFSGSYNLNSQSLKMENLVLQERYRSFVFQTDSLNLPYRLHVPKNAGNKKLPLVILLHGSGERGTDNVKHLVHGASAFVTDSLQQKHPCYVLVPQCPENTRWVPINLKSKSHIMPSQPSLVMVTLMQLISKIEKDYPVDLSRVYCTGLSMGGFGTWDLSIRCPNSFAAIAPVCGGADPSKAQKIPHIPQWVFHGGKDNVVLPENSRNMVAALKKAKAKELKYTEFPEVLHNAWDFAYAMPEFFAWLFSHQRETPKIKRLKK
jgi:predicted peptidase